MQGIDPRTSRMLSERSTIWATSPVESDIYFENDTKSLIKSRTRKSQQAIRDDIF